MLSVGHLLAALTAYQVNGSEPRVSFATNDSREAGAHCLFVAFVGEHVDGHAYVADAFARGTIVALVERAVEGFAVVDTRGGSAEYNNQTPVQIVVESSLKALQQCARYWRQQYPLRVIGITGSVGKTTTKELTYKVLAQRYRTLKSDKNFNTEIGLPLQLLNLRPDHERAVLEMGMYVPGDIALLASIALPDVGVVTNVGTVHVERAGSIEAIQRGKQELVEALPPQGVAILNADDPRVLAMRAHTRARVMTYGLTPTADLYASEIESMGLDGMRFTLHYRGEAVSVQIPMLGRHSVHTALRAVAVGLVEGLSWDAIVPGLRNHRDELRLLVVPGPQGATLIDDAYNASPQSSLAALNLLADLDGRKVAVLGDMLELGSDEIPGHQRVGRRAHDVADVIVAVGRLGRLIGEEALAMGSAASDVHFAADAEAAIAILNNIIKPADMVLIKGSHGAGLDKVVSALTVN